MKRNLNLGKHTTTSSRLRSSLEALFRQPGIKRIIYGRSDGCRHKKGDGTLKFQRQEGKKIILNGYSKDGVMKVIVILEDNADLLKIKKWIENT